MKFNNLMNTFTSGEWSPKMRSRSDTAEFAKSCELLKNFMPRIQGGAFRRPGTVRVPLDASGEVDIQNAFDADFVKSKLIPRVLSDGTRQVLAAFDAQPSTTWFVVDAENPDSSNVAVGSVSSAANFNVFAAGLKYAQVGDLVFMVDYTLDAGHQPRVWMPVLLGGTLKTYTEQVAPILAHKCVPYRDLQALGSSVALTPGAATGSTTLTASSAFFAAGHVGAYFKLTDSGVTGVVRVTGFTSSTVVNVDVLRTVAVVAHGASVTSSWEESAWSDYRGWPRTITSYQGRLIFGGNKSQPETIWGTRIGNVFDLMERPFEQDVDFTGYRDDNSRPFTLTPATGGVSGTIRALSAAKTLCILTERAEIVGYGNQGALGPNDVTFESSTSFGAATPMPARANNYMVFVQNGGGKVRDILFNNDENQYKSADLGFVADHLVFDTESNTKDQIVEIVGSESDSSYLWAKTIQGRLICLTLDREYQVNAWSQAVIGGSSEAKTYPLVKSVTSIHSNTVRGDRVFLLVARRINGANKMFMEYFDVAQESKTFNIGLRSAAYMDYKASYNTGGPASTTVVVGTHMIGQTLQVIADGQFVGEKVVDGSGNITLAIAATNSIFGFKCPAEIRSMPYEIGAQVPGTPQAFIKRIDEITVKFYVTRGCKFGTDPNDLFDIDFKDPMANMNAIPTFFTGMKTLKTAANYEREAQVIIRTETPWPCNVLSIISKGMLYD